MNLENKESMGLDKGPFKDGYTWSFKIRCMTDIFITAFQYFIEVREKLYLVMNNSKFDTSNFTYGNNEDM